MKEINNNNKKKAVIYCRVSTKEQVDEGNSLLTQQRVCREYCLKNNYEISEIFLEKGESAKTTDRTELQKLLKYCANAKNCIKAVIIYKIDRFARNTDDYSQLRLLLKRYSVEIKSTSEYFEDSPVGRFLENTMANIAQFDNDIRAERCAGGMKEAVRDGRYVWLAPIGYSNVKAAGRATIAQHPVMGSIVKETFALVAKNIYSTEEVRKMVVSKGLVNSKGRPISKSYFYVMLANELYAGWIAKFGERHKGAFEPIVTEEIFNQVQRVLKNRTHIQSPHISDNPDFPLRRFAFNEKREKLTGSWSKGRRQKYAYYRFKSGGSSFDKHNLETTFMAFMDRFKLDEVYFNKLKEHIQRHLVESTSKGRKTVEQLQNLLDELKAKQSLLLKKNLDGVISDLLLKQQLEIVDKDISETYALIASIPNKDVDILEVLDLAKEYLKNPSKIWMQAKIDVKLKLQWFQFPLGITFKDNCFGTAEISSVFVVKHHFLDPKSNVVDYRFKKKNNPEVTNDILNIKLAGELKKLAEILKHTSDDPG